jgi:hypothetical protein
MTAPNERSRRFSAGKVRRLSCVQFLASRAQRKRNHSCKGDIDVLPLCMAAPSSKNPVTYRVASVETDAARTALSNSSPINGSISRYRTGLQAEPEKRSSMGEREAVYCSPAFVITMEYYVVSNATCALLFAGNG